MRVLPSLIAIVGLLGLGGCAQLGSTGSSSASGAASNEGATGSTDSTTAGSTDESATAGSTDGAAGSTDSAAEICATVDRGPSDLTRGREGSFSPTSDVTQQAALLRVNAYRVGAGLEPLRGNALLEHSATAHADFLAGSPQQTCWSHVHDEVDAAGCNGFTGVDVGSREQAQGYDWQRASEVVDWEDTPEGAVDAWVWTVYHRAPLFDWRNTDAGFGHAQGPFGTRPDATHAVMNLGAQRNTATPAAPTSPVVFPLPGQTNVPPGFRGDLEAPTPPAPGGARTWPRGHAAGAVISVHFPNSNWSVQSHEILAVDNQSCTAVPHTFISKDNDPNLQRPTPANDVYFYADDALEPGHEYVAHVRATVNGTPWERTWSFTTRAEQPAS